MVSLSYYIIIIVIIMKNLMCWRKKNEGRFGIDTPNIVIKKCCKILFNYPSNNICVSVK